MLMAAAGKPDRDRVHVRTEREPIARPQSSFTAKHQIVPVLLLSVLLHSSPISPCSFCPRSPCVIDQFIRRRPSHGQPRRPCAPRDARAAAIHEQTTAKPNRQTDKQTDGAADSVESGDERDREGRSDEQRRAGEPTGGRGDVRAALGSAQRGSRRRRHFCCLSVSPPDTPHRVTSTRTTRARAHERSGAQAQRYVQRNSGRRRHCATAVRIH